MISIQDLEWFFSSSDSGGSTFGATLERQEMFAITRKHKRMRTVVASWKLKPKEPGGKLEKCIHYAQAATLHEIHKPSSYEMDWAVVDRRVRVDRFLRRQQPSVRRTLECLYGLESPWEKTCARLSICKLTPIGASVAAAKRARDVGNVAGGQERHNSDTQLIWNDIQDQVVKPNDMRRMRHIVMFKQADALWLDAQRAIARARASA